MNTNLEFLIKEAYNKGVSQRKIAEYCSIPHSVLSRLRSGDRPLRQKHIDILTTFFGVTADFLLNKSDYGILCEVQYETEPISISIAEYNAVKDYMVTNVINTPNSFSIIVKTFDDADYTIELDHKMYRELIGKLENFDIDSLLVRKIDTLISNMDKEQLKKTISFIEQFVK